MLPARGVVEVSDRLPPHPGKINFRSRKQGDQGENRDNEALNEFYKLVLLDRRNGCVSLDKARRLRWELSRSTTSFAAITQKVKVSVCTKPCQRRRGLFRFERGCQTRNSNFW